MRFKFPSELSYKTLYNLVKRLFKEDFFGFARNIKEKVFIINTTTDSYVAVVSYDEGSEKIGVFYNDEGYLTCHHVFLGDEFGLNLYGFTYLGLDYHELDEELEDVKYKRFKVNNGLIDYDSSKRGEYSRQINEEECLVLIEVIQYLFHIKRAYDDGEWEMEEVNDLELITIFDFDDINYTYQSSVMPLGDFDFLPGFKHKKPCHKQEIQELKNQEIVPGTLYLSLLFGPGNESYQYQNKMSVDLKSQILYLASDSGVFDYKISHSLNKNLNKSIRSSLFELLKRNTLCDTIITNNYLIYIEFFNDFKALGIELKLSKSNTFANFLTFGISQVIASQNYQILVENLDEFKKTYPQVLPDILNLDIEEELYEDDDLEEEKDDEFFDEDNHTNFVS